MENEDLKYIRHKVDKIEAKLSDIRVEFTEDVTKLKERQKLTSAMYGMLGSLVPAASYVAYKVLS